MDIEYVNKLESSSRLANAIFGEVTMGANALLNQLAANEPGNPKIQELFVKIREDIDDAARRADSGTLRIGILGGRGSGKSTLANALVGTPILPDAALASCTSLPTTIRYNRGNYCIRITSESSENAFESHNVPLNELQQKVWQVCDESQNPGNRKKVTGLTVGIDSDILVGKEIVDVPGFTRGTPLHQAFAERYAKHLCDACLVLINNPEAVEFGGYQGIPALAKAFEDRLDTVVFIINKCDLAKPPLDSPNAEPMIFTRLTEELFNSLGSSSSRVRLRKISAANSLGREGKQYHWQDLTGDLNRMTVRRSLVITLGLMGRLISSFNQLAELCNLAGPELDELEKRIKTLRADAVPPVSAVKARLNELRERQTQATNALSVLQVIEVPPIIAENHPFVTKVQLIDAVQAQMDDVRRFVEKEQAKIFLEFASAFETEVEALSGALYNRLESIMKLFKLKAAIEIPKADIKIELKDFNSAAIERLRPSNFLLWQAHHLPDLLSQEVILVEVPMTLTIIPGVLSIPIRPPILPVLLTQEEMTKGFREKLAKTVQEEVEGYVRDSLKHVTLWAFNAYSKAVDEYAQRCLAFVDEYAKRVQTAKAIVSPDAIAQFTSFVEQLRKHQERVTTQINIEENALASPMRS